MVTKIKRYNPSEKDLVSDWHVIDARGQVLGRLATKIATLLMGKHRPGYVPHMLSGDFVVVTNASEVVLTGNKAEQITYKRHTFQRSGHLKEIPLARVQQKFPERVIEHAVRGMLPRNKLGERMIRMLKVYPGEEHPHAAQIIGSERRPEREAAAAAKAAEAADSKKKAATRAEIAAEAQAKTDEKPEAKPASRRRSSSSSTKASTSSKTTRSRSTSKAKDADSGEKKPATRTRRTSSRSKKTEE